MDSPAKPGVKVVARFRDGEVVKGYLDLIPAGDFQSLVEGAPAPLPPEVDIRCADSGKSMPLPLRSLKALFFVKTFEGRKEHQEVRFFEKNPPIKGLWVRGMFYDGECFEGIVRNTIHYVVEPGFFLKPPDPHSNNEIFYVVKEALTDFHVLGVRKDF
jgi:hypothetical protein